MAGRGATSSCQPRSRVCRADRTLPGYLLAGAWYHRVVGREERLGARVDAGRQRALGASKGGP